MIGAWSGIFSEKHQQIGAFVQYKVNQAPIIKNESLDFQKRYTNKKTPKHADHGAALISSLIWLFSMDM